MAIVGLIGPRAWAAGEGRVYIYAQRLTAARSWLPIWAGNTVAAELKQGKFFAINLAPGRYTFHPDRGVPVTVDVHRDEDLYLRLDWNYQLGRAPIPVLTKAP